MARNLTVKERWKSWPIAVKVAVLVVLYIVLSGCAIVYVRDSEDASSCDALSSTVSQGGARVPLWVVYALSYSGSALVVDQEPVGVDQTRRCSVCHADIR